MTKEQSATEFLKQETEKLKKQERTTWIVGLILAAIIGIYMTYLSSQMNSIVYNPKILAKSAALYIDRRAPHFVSSLEKHLIEEAPAISDQLVQQSYPLIELATEASKQQYDILFGFIPTFEVQVAEVTQAFMKEQRPLIQEAYKGKNLDKLVNRLTNKIIKHLESESEKQFQAKINGKNHKGLFKVSLAQYKEMIKYLRALSRRNPARLTPRERLERRVIVAWAITFGDAIGLKFYEG